MEEKIYKDLQSISYGGELMSGTDFGRIIHDGLSATQYSHIVAALCKQLRLFTRVAQDVNEMRSAEDVNSFVMDVSSFLQELECPYTRVITVPLNERLATPENRLLVLDFLIGELQAARLNYLANGPEVAETRLSPLGENLKAVVRALGLSLPPADVGIAQLFGRLESRLQEVISSLPADTISAPLLQTPLNKDQWEQLEKFNDSMGAEYRLRREMLLKRFDVTVQSFSWSERAKAKEAELKQVYLPRRKEMTVESTVSVADILAAREDLLFVEKTSSHSVRKFTQCAVNKVMMGIVPDRGGRPSEAVVPPRDMPGFRARDAGQGHGGGGFRGRGGFDGGRGFRGGRVQSGWGSRGDHLGGGRGRGNRGGSRSFHRGGGGGGYQNGRGDW